MSTNIFQARIRNDWKFNIDAIMKFADNPFIHILKTRSLPQEIVETLTVFCESYLQAICVQEKDLHPFLATFNTFLDSVVDSLRDPPHFAYYHQAIRKPFDYYQLGLDFIRPLVDMQRSSVKSQVVLKDIVNTLSDHHNVILFANHQTEIDPQIISLLIEKEFPQLAEEMIFVAGHRVVSDPLAIPLSLGRNLLCIYSKRHIDYPPEKKVEKLQHNTRTLKVLEELLSEGGKCVYVAPSGGRDRRDQEGHIEVAPFDPHSIEMFFLIAKQAKKPTHFHTLALATYPLLPPPNHVLVELGEARHVHFAPAHLVFGPKIDMEEIAPYETTKDKKLRRQERAAYIWRKIVQDYQQIFL
jgi:glycerol-3-phosphate O-acyltransferase